MAWTVAQIAPAARGTTPRNAIQFFRIAWSGKEVRGAPCGSANFAAASCRSARFRVLRSGASKPGYGLGCEVGDRFLDACRKHFDVIGPAALARCKANPRQPVTLTLDDFPLRRSGLPRTHQGGIEAGAAA